MNKDRGVSSTVDILFHSSYSINGARVTDMPMSGNDGTRSLRAFQITTFTHGSVVVVVLRLPRSGRYNADHRRTVRSIATHRLGA